MSDENNQLFKEIDRSTIETCVGGYDSRPFDSKLYLNAPFDAEFIAALNLEDDHHQQQQKVVHSDDKSAAFSAADEDEHESRKV